MRIGQSLLVALERALSPAKKRKLDPGTRMLGRLSGAKYAGTETVNGIRSNRYTYDEKAAVAWNSARCRARSGWLLTAATWSRIR